MNNKLQILSTRPLGHELVDKARASGIQIDEVAFIRIEPIVNASLKDQLMAFSSKAITAVFTSANSVNVVASSVAATAPWTIYCIGKATKQVADGSFGENRPRPGHR